MNEPCPDESVFSRLAAGELARLEMRQLELHLDQCPACNELLRLVASLGPDGPRPVTSPPDPPESRTMHVPAQTWALLATGVMLGVQAVACALLFAPVWRWFESRGWNPASSTASLAVGEVAAAVGFGLLVGMAAFAAEWLEWRNAPKLRTIQAVLCCMSVVMAPIAIAVLLGTRKIQRGRSVYLRAGRPARVWGSRFADGPDM